MNFDRFEVTLGVPLAIGELKVLRRMDAEVLLACRLSNLFQLVLLTRIRRKFGTSSLLITWNILLGFEKQTRPSCWGGWD